MKSGLPVCRASWKAWPTLVCQPGYCPFCWGAIATRASAAIANRVIIAVASKSSPPDSCVEEADGKSTAKAKNPGGISRPLRRGDSEQNYLLRDEESPHELFSASPCLCGCISLRRSLLRDAVEVLLAAEVHAVVV